MELIKLVVDVLYFIDVWYSAICTIFITFMAIFFNLITKRLIYPYPTSADFLCIGPDLGLTALSLDIFIFGIYPKSFTFSKYNLTNPFNIWVTAFLIDLAIYLIIIICCHYGSIHRQIISGNSCNRMRLRLLTQSGNLLGIVLILTTLVLMVNSI
jgi:hypothetical protein